jgi:GT2 family glycosyltransferase
VDRPFVSIVVPTLGRRASLGEALETLLSQDYPADRYEVVVVANGAPPGSLDRVRAFTGREDGPHVEVLSLPGPNANRARNAGIRTARGDPICLVDDDVLAPPGWLAALVDGALRHPSAGCVGGPVRPRFDSSPPRTCAEHELSGTHLDEGSEDRRVTEVWAGNMALRRSAVERVGPLLERLRVAHESEWEGRLRTAGGQIVYVPDAWLWHRRAGEDMRLWSLVRGAFMRGYTVVALGQPVKTRVLVRDARLCLWHALRTGCTRGLEDGVRQLGSLCAIAARRRRRPWATSLRGPWPAYDESAR